MLIHRLLGLAVLFSVLGCHGCYRELPPPLLTETPPVPVASWMQLCSQAAPKIGCVWPAQVEDLLSSPDLEIVASQAAPTGIQGAKVLVLRGILDGRQVTFRAKWRSWPSTDWRSDPRRELAAYEVQKLYLPAHRYVVPPTRSHCFAIDGYRAKVDGEATALPGTRCAFGYLSFWLEDTQAVFDADRAGWFDSSDGVLDKSLFDRNRVFRTRLADANILTYLIEHTDTHWKQFVISKDPKRPVIYVVDNGMSFGVGENTDLGTHDLSEIRVSVLPSDSLDRLQQVDESRIEELERLEILRLDERGILVPCPSCSSTRDLRTPPDTAEVRDGQLTIGLIGSERRKVAGKILELSSKRREGRVATF